MEFRVGFGTLGFFLVSSKFLYCICCLHHDSWLELDTCGLCWAVVKGHYFALGKVSSLRWGVQLAK